MTQSNPDTPIITLYWFGQKVHLGFSVTSYVTENMLSGLNTSIKR